VGVGRQIKERQQRWAAMGYSINVWYRTAVPRGIGYNAEGWKSHAEEMEKRRRRDDDTPGEEDRLLGEFLRHSVFAVLYSNYVGTTYAG
jgi:hypothetical protein